MYAEYRIKGFKVELFPQTQVIGQANSSAITGIEIYSNPESTDGGAPTTYPTTDQAMRMLDYKMYTPHAGRIKRYYNTLNARMTRFHGAYGTGGWHKCTDPAANQGLTYIKFNTVNYALGDKFGKWTVTWYVEFRNRTV